MDRVDIINTALAKSNSGGNYVSGSDSFKQQDLLFEASLKHLLGRRYWSFFLRKAKLSNYIDVEEEEDFQFSKKMSLPEGFLRPFDMRISYYTTNVSVDINRLWAEGGPIDIYTQCLTDYDLHGNFLYCNVSPVFLEYQHGIFEEAGPLNPSFELALLFNLTASFYLSLKEDMNGFDRNMNLFEREVQNAINQDRLASKRNNRNTLNYAGRT